MITIINYGSGNVRAIQNILARCGFLSRISTSPEDISTASALILPGVGHFSTCINRLDQSGLRPVLQESVMGRKVPLLGICAGMQILFERSEEDLCTGKGLGFLKGRVVRFGETGDARARIPNIGWRTVRLSPAGREIFGVAESRFYFTHSYHAPLASGDDALFVSDNGYEFTAGVMQGNIIGVQFHPEKSHSYGIDFFTRYLRWIGYSND